MRGLLRGFWPVLLVIFFASRCVWCSYRDAALSASMKRASRAVPSSISAVVR